MGSAERILLKITTTSIPAAIATILSAKILCGPNPVGTYFGFGSSSK